MRRGEEAAKAQWGSLLALKKKIGIAEDYTPKQHGPILLFLMRVRFM